LKLSLSARLILSFLAVILVAMGIATPLAWLAVERLYLDSQRDNLLAQAQLVAAALRNQSPPSATPSPYAQTSNVLPGIHTRVIDPQGAAVIDLFATGEPLQPGGLALPQLAQNAAGLVTPQELVSRPEIAQAQLGQPTTAIRRVEVAGGKRVLYAAAPVISDDGNVSQIVYLATPLPDTQWSSLPVAVRWQFIGAILISILLACLAGLLLSRRIAQPLEKLAQAAHAVAGGDLGQSVPVDPGINELATLGSAFNSMTSSLQYADRAKTAFISDVSHELRTPLTVIKGTIETLEDGALDDIPGRGKLLTSMARETERLIKLVNDLLVLTRADAGALNLQRQRVELGELVRARCEHFERIASQCQVSLRTVTSLSPGEQNTFPVLADPDRLAQVLDNLLDNAIRYSPPGSEVIVTLALERGRFACQVSDTGPGIPAEHLPFIFERFYRANQARGRKDGGSGLGLSIVRSLVLAHGGRIDASSTEGKGTSVTFWLPAAETDTQLRSS
jgi:signal transduction histidine kinase